MQREKLVNDVFQILLVAFILVMALPIPDLAWAQQGSATDLQGGVQSVQNNISLIPPLISGLFYIGGAALMGAGVLKLKHHTENPSGTKLGEALGRLGAGAALIAIPFFSNTVIGTLGLQAGAGGPAFTPFQPVTQ